MFGVGLISEIVTRILTSMRNANAAQGSAPDTPVQLDRLRFAGTPWTTVGSPTDIDATELSERLSLDITLSEIDFLERFSAYRNALAELQGKKLKRKWSRKSMAESFVSAQVDSMRHQMGAMIDACGPLPDAKDAKALKKYVEAVLAWTAKQSK